MSDSSAGHAAAAVAHNPFVGREDDLARLVAAYDAASSGSPRIVLVAGEAGIGKTRLVAELGTAVDDGWRSGHDRRLPRSRRWRSAAPSAGRGAARIGTDHAMAGAGGDARARPAAAGAPRPGAGRRRVRDRGATGRVAHGGGRACDPRAAGRRSANACSSSRTSTGSTGLLATSSPSSPGTSPLSRCCSSSPRGMRTWEPRPTDGSPSSPGSRAWSGSTSDGWTAIRCERSWRRSSAPILIHTPSTGRGAAPTAIPTSSRSWRPRATITRRRRSRRQ